MNDGLLLTGLDGSNPLAFLAALGTLRTLTLSLPDEKVRMSWEQHEGAWRPRMWCSVSSADGFINAISERLGPVGGAWKADKKLPFAADRLRAFMLQAAEANDRDTSDLLAAFGCEAMSDDKGNFADTAARMVRTGDSNGQGLLHYAATIAARCTQNDIWECLFQRWTYRANGSSLRWDPAEDAQYALQAVNPSDEKTLSVIGANRLALEALPMLVVVPQSVGTATVGFREGTARGDLAFCWPLWRIAITFPVVKSLLLLAVPDVDQASRQSLLTRGIAALFSAGQYKPNKYYRNFRPSQEI
jgi:hypothetical protein